jgi:hypothetical protein
MQRSCAAPLALALLVSPASVRGQAGAVDPDTREVAAYQLTVPTLQKVAAAHRQMAVALRNDPRFLRLARLKAEKKQLEAKHNPSALETARLEALPAEIESAEAGLPSLLEGVKTLADMEANIRKEPLVANALASAGLAPREYGTFMLALASAALVHGMQKAGALKDVPADLNERMNLENVKFVAAHEAEIKSLMADVHEATGEE